MVHFSDIIMFLHLGDGQVYFNNFNKLTHVPREIPSNATKIYLNSNEISNIESGTFDQYFQCTKLWLDYNKITQVRNDMWTGLLTLEWLSLEHNNIDYIEPHAFADLTSLKGLYLHNNKLQALPDNILPLRQRPTIEILTLHDNNLKRGELGWLRELCEDGQIQEYTIRGDDIPCTSIRKASKQQNQEIQPIKNTYKSRKEKNGEKEYAKIDTFHLSPTRQGERLWLLTGWGKMKDIWTFYQHPHQFSDTVRRQYNLKW